MRTFMNVTLYMASAICLVAASICLGEMVVHVPWAIVGVGITCASFYRYQRKLVDWPFFLALGAWVSGHEYEAAQLVNAPYRGWIYGSGLIASLAFLWLAAHQKAQLPAMELELEEKEELILEDQG